MPTRPTRSTPARRASSLPWSGSRSTSGSSPTSPSPSSVSFPRRTFENVDSRKKAMKVEDLLTMSSGLGWVEGDATYRRMYTTDRDWVKFVLGLPMDAAPGRVFNYSSGNTHILSAIIQKTAPGNLYEFARAQLVHPAGHQESPLGQGSLGHPHRRLGPEAHAPGHGQAGIPVSPRRRVGREAGRSRGVGARIHQSAPPGNQHVEVRVPVVDLSAGPMVCGVRTVRPEHFRRRRVSTSWPSSRRRSIPTTPRRCSCRTTSCRPARQTDPR